MVPGHTGSAQVHEAKIILVSWYTTEYQRSDIVRAYFVSRKSNRRITCELSIQLSIINQDASAAGLQTTASGRGVMKSFCVMMLGRGILVTHEPDREQNVCLDEGYGDKSDNEQLKGEGYNLVAKINSYIAYLRRTQQGNQ